MVNGLFFPVFSFWLSLVLTHLSARLGSANVVYSDYVKHNILFYHCSGWCMSMWSCTCSCVAFRVLRRLNIQREDKILANKLSQIVSHLVKHPIYVTVSFEEECESL